MSGADSSPANRLRVVFMGTPDFAVPTLERLLDEHQVVAAYTQPDRPAGRGRAMRASPVKRLAEEHGVDVRQPRSLRKDADAVHDLERLRADVVVVAAYGLILPPGALAAAKHGCLNVHASLLPRWRGAAPVAHAILAGDEQTGVTIMQMDEGMDTGPILAKRAICLDRQDTTGSLTERLAAEGADLLASTLSAWVGGAVSPVTQEDRLATYAPRISPDDGRLDWSQPAEALERRVRAMNPWPGAHTELPDGRRLKVHAARVDRGSPGGHAALAEPGTVTSVAGFPVIGTGRDRLTLIRVQAEGKRPMPGDAFLRGRSDLVGARLATPREAATS